MLMSCKIAQCASTLETMAVTPANEFALSGDSSVVLSGGFVYFSAGAAIYRCPQSGCGAGPTLLYGGDTYSIDGLSVGALDIYFSEVNDGQGSPAVYSVQYCPLAGCSGTPPRIDLGT